MSSIFTKDDKFVDKPNRNSFDLSFQNNLSLKFGKLVPCFCQEVLPGDSFKIKPTFGLRFLPQVFPVQTRMKAHMHFFYVRNRTLWKDWMDFIGKTKGNLTMPYLVSSEDSVDNWDGDESYHESSIFDYMGLPTVVDAEVDSPTYDLYSSSGRRKKSLLGFNSIEYDDNLNNSTVNITYQVLDQNLNLASSLDNGRTFIDYHEYLKPIKIPFNQYGNGKIKVSCFASNNNAKCYLVAKTSEVNPNGALSDTSDITYIPLSLNYAVGAIQMVDTTFNRTVDLVLSTTQKVSIREIIGYFYYLPDGSNLGINYINGHVNVEVKPSVNRNYPLSSLAITTLPYGDGEWQYRINALPFRAYEAIYNSFYRNAENNPFKINGVIEYNRYVKSLDGGAQLTSDFHLFDRNWEDDAFTTAVPTPQQGDAPRVGLTGSPNEPIILHYQDDNDQIGQLHLTVNSDGHVVMLEHGQDAPPTLVDGLNDMINFGITINDLRNINAFTLWKEKNVRRGYKYPDQMMSHYGVSIEYNDLLMPEFIGGVSRDVTVNQISQTVETSTGNLGDMAGQAYVVGDGHSISKYCDEHGFIIGILSVVPVPNYSQLIPKHFFKHDAFDYFFPEFGKIGMQPIANKEIASTASWLQNKGDETFGYQRAWYDYLANVDQVHGKFNSDFYDFLIQRKFGDVPELGESFTTIKNEDLNNIFYVDDNEDKILGQIYFDVKAVRPIPLFGIPSLE